MEDLGRRAEFGILEFVSKPSGDGRVDWAGVTGTKRLPLVWYSAAIGADWLGQVITGTCMPDPTQLLGAPKRCLLIDPWMSRGFHQLHPL